MTEEDLDDIAVGAAILGTGGGGSPYHGRLFARQAVRDHGPVELVALEAIPDDAVAVMSAMMGAPTVAVEKLPGDEALSALAALERHTGRPATHLVASEAGGFNSLTPLGVGAQRRLPVVDADAMGRAFPELQMVMPSLYGMAATPMAIADDNGNATLIEAADNVAAERLARAFTVEAGGTAAIALFAQSGRRAKETLVPGTISLAREVGALAGEAQRLERDAVTAIASRLAGCVVFRGKIGDVRRRTEGGFTRGETAIEGTGPHEGSGMTLSFQNEFLVAETGGEMVVSVPDLIIVLDEDSGQPVTTEALRYGFRVAVVGAPCDPRWRSADGLRVVGPRYFGYDLEYRPVEQGARPQAGMNVNNTRRTAT